MENLPTLMEEKDIAIHREPTIVLEEAKKAAKALNDVISNKKKPVIINNEQYLEFEDWMTVARFYGVTVKVISTAPISFGEVQGFEARAVAILVKTGEEISAAEAMCLNDESNWKNRPLFMLRSMAQTRACAKALRNVLAWVVVLAGYRPTPAEEMMGNGEQKPELKKQGKEEPPASPPENIYEGVVDKVEVKEGEKNGKKWMRYGIHIEDKTFGTFDKTLGQKAENLQGELVSITFKQEGKFFTCMAIEPLERGE